MKGLRTTKIVALTVTLLAAAGGVAYASVPDGQGGFPNWYAKASGIWRSIDHPAQSCGGGGTRLAGTCGLWDKIREPTGDTLRDVGSLGLR